MLIFGHPAAEAAAIADQMLLDQAIDGLLHLDDMSWTKRPKHPSAMYQEGDEIEVMVIGIDKEARRIKLGLKQLSSPATAARGNLDLVADNYTLGRALLVDLIDSQTNALNAELAAGYAEASREVVVELARGLGVWLAAGLAEPDFFNSTSSETRQASCRPQCLRAIS